MSPDELGAGSEPIAEEVIILCQRHFFTQMYLLNFALSYPFLLKQVYLANPEDTGLHVWADVFRRADKNDDGKISYREFCQHFR